jgi:hypothetical protein
MNRFVRQLGFWIRYWLGFGLYCKRIGHRFGTFTYLDADFPWIEQTCTICLLIRLEPLEVT